MRPRRATAHLACVALGLPLLAGCGGGGGESADIGPAAVAPASAPLYFDLTVRPEGSTKTGAEAALAKILDTDDPGGKLVSLIDQAGRQEPPAQRFTYRQDIAPWLGDQIGVFLDSFVGEGTGAAVIETTDPTAALDFVRRSEGVNGTMGEVTYNGATYQRSRQGDNAFAFVGDFLVFGDETGVKAAIDASQGGSLGDSSDFKDAIGELPDDRLGTFYTVPKNLLAAIPGDQISRGSKAFFEKAAGENLDEPVTGSITAAADRIELDLRSQGGGDVETPESSLIGDVPGDAWLALGIGDLGSGVRQALDRAKEAGVPGFEQAISQIESTTGSSVEELTGALGDAVIYVRGTTEETVSGALVVQVKDPDLTGRLLTQLQGLLSLGGQGGVKPLSLPGGGSGLQISDPSNFPQPVEIAQQGDKFVIGYGAGSAQQALQPGQTLGSSPAFTSAGDRISSLGADLFLSFPPIFRLAESSGAKADPDYVQAKPYIDALDYLISGSGSADGGAEVKAVLGLK